MLRKSSSLCIRINAHNMVHYKHPPNDAIVFTLQQRTLSAPSPEKRNKAAKSTKRCPVCSTGQDTHALVNYCIQSTIGASSVFPGVKLTNSKASFVYFTSQASPFSCVDAAYAFTLRFCSRSQSYNNQAVRNDQR